MRQSLETKRLRSRLRALVAVAVVGSAGCGGGAPAGPPLQSLAVSPLALSPAFSPEIHDYTVTCAAGLNQLTLDVTAAPGATVAVLAPQPLPAAALRSVALDVAEDQAIVVQAAAPGGASEQYWVRCLPHDFPRPTATKHPEVGTPGPGWYLIGNAFVAQGYGGFAMVLDGNGTPVWYKRSPAGGMVGVDRAADNTIATVPALGVGGFGIDGSGEFTITHLDSGAAERLKAVGAPTDHHELRVLPSGNRMILSYPQLAGVDLTGLQNFGSAATIADCLIQEISPAGAVVWQWRGSEHVDPVKESTFPAKVSIAGRDVVDVYHCNSIDVDDRNGVLLSARHADAVLYIDKGTGKVAWKLGGASYSKDGAQLLKLQGDPAGFYRQHDARFRPGGRISLFDNHTQVQGVARGVEYAIDLGAGTATLVFELKGAVNSQAMGSFRRQDDGTSVIGWGAPSAGPALALTEIDAAGRTLFEVTLPPGDFSYRAIKVPTAGLDLDLLRRGVAGH